MLPMLYHTDWKKFEMNIPAGVKYIAINYKSNYQYFLYVDAFKLSDASVLCTPPADITITNVTANSLALEWTNNGAESWNVIVSETAVTNFALAEYETVYSNSIIKNNLLPSTNYFVYLQSNCGSGETSDWTDKFLVTTPCELMDSPYMQNFSGAEYPPSCWSFWYGLASDAFQGTLPTSTYYGWNQNNTNNGIEGEHIKINVFSSVLRHWFLSPNIALEPNSLLTFDIALTATESANPVDGVGADDKFMVLISTNGGGAWQESEAIVWDAAGTDYVFGEIPNTAQRVTIDLSKYTGTIRIALYAESTVDNFDNDLHIGNLRIGPDVPCQAPTNLTAVQEGEAVVLQWTASETANAYNIYRNNMIVASNITETTYTDEVNVSGEYCYTVKSVCSGLESEASNEACVNLIITYTIVATADAGGTITPNGEVSVNQGENATFAIQPNENYVVSAIIIDGVNMGDLEVFTFENVNANHTIHAEFDFTDSMHNIIDNGLTIYPIPAKDKLTVKGKNICKIELFDLKGQSVATYPIDSNNEDNTISVSTIANGVYLMRTYFSDGSIANRKLIIQHQ